MAAHAYYVKKHCLQYMDKEDWQATWDLMFEVNQGSRYMKEKQDEKGSVANEAAAFVGELPEGPHIKKVMNCFNEYFQGEEKGATSNYSFLSEFCHPNSFAFTNHIDMGRLEHRTNR